MKNIIVGATQEDLWFFLVLKPGLSEKALDLMHASDGHAASTSRRRWVLFAVGPMPEFYYRGPKVLLPCKDMAPLGQPEPGGRTRHLAVPLRSLWPP